MKTRDILCDSGVLISLTACGLDDLLYFFAHKHGVRFIIPPSVEYESILHPIQSDLKKHLFSAMKIKRAMDDGVVVKVEADIINDVQHLISDANRLYYIRGQPVQLIDRGEAEAVCLAKFLGVEYLLLDERTTRLLIEAPLMLKEHLEKEFSVNVMVNKTNLRQISSNISQFKVLRSSELVMLAYEHGYFSNFHGLERKAVEAALYRLKYAGCSVSFDEIADYLNSLKR